VKNKKSNIHKKTRASHKLFLFMKNKANGKGLWEQIRAPRYEEIWNQHNPDYRGVPSPLTDNHKNGTTGREKKGENPEGKKKSHKGEGARQTKKKNRSAIERERKQLFCNLSLPNQRRKSISNPPLKKKTVNTSVFQWVSLSDEACVVLRIQTCPQLLQVNLPSYNVLPKDSFSNYRHK